MIRAVKGNPDVYLIDIGRDESTPLYVTSGPRQQSSVVFGWDPRRVYSSRNGPGGQFEKAANSAGDKRPLLASGELKAPLDWSRDGQWLLYKNARHPKTGLDLWAAPMARDGKPVLVMDTTFDQTAGQFFPDGRWVAYQVNKSRPVQIYIRPFPEPGNPLQVTTAGGPRRDGAPTGKSCSMSGSTAT